MGSLYESGLAGLPKDHTKSLKHFQASAVRGYAFAMQSLGARHTTGTLGLEKVRVTPVDLPPSLAFGAKRAHISVSTSPYTAWLPLTAMLHLAASYAPCISVELEYGRALAPERRQASPT